MIGTSVIKELKVYLGLCQESMTELFLAKTFNGKFNRKVNKFVISRLNLKCLSNSRWVWMKNPTLLTIFGSIPFSTALLFSISWVVKTYAYHVIVWIDFLIGLIHYDTRRATRNFLGQERFCGITDKHFVKNTRKKDPQGKILEVFLLVTLKTRFSMEDSSQGWTQLGPFFPKSGHFFRFPHPLPPAPPPTPPPSPLSCWPGYQYLFRISSLKRVDLTKNVNSFHQSNIPFLYRLKTQKKPVE